MIASGSPPGIRLETVSALGEAQVTSVARRAVEVLRSGGIVLHPTETVYGLGGDGSALNNALIARIKKRDPAQPLILLTIALDTLAGLVDGLIWPDDAAILAERFWPGPLTLVLPCRGAPLGLRGPDGGVAVRVSPNPIVEKILEEWGAPMTSTSANLTNAPPPRTADAAAKPLRDRGDLDDVRLHVLVIDAGRLPPGSPSTIVNLVGGRPRLLREGSISLAELEKILPGIEDERGHDD